MPLLRVDGGRAARSVEKQVSSLLNGMTRRREPARLTSDLHGGCSPKLTHGFDETPLAGRGTVPTVRHHQRTTKDARCQASFLRHCSAAEAVGSL